jgi:hypothetical protein
MKLFDSLIKVVPLTGIPLTLMITTTRADAQAPAIPPAPASFSQQVLDAQNKYRAQVGVPPFVWSDDLANSAQQWVNTLSANSTFQHDPGNTGQGENIWMGTSGTYSYAQMVDSWGSEMKNFQNGVFPNVSTTGDWSAVGHYTQMVWRTTTSVGCAGLDGSDGNYRLVCRYGPPGNVTGQQVF